MEEYNKFNSYYAIIMSGGRGERFWPLSTPSKPKPFLELFNKKSLFQLTYQRISKFFPKEHIFIILSQEHLKIAMEQIPEVPENNFIIEPIGRDTTAACCYSSFYVSKKYHNPTIIIFPSDHYIENDDEFYKCLVDSLELLNSKSSIVIFGIKPTRPDTNYGYIEVGEKFSLSDKRIFFSVKQFKEKPNKELAELYFKKENYYWNSGIFCWNYNNLMKLIKIHQPKVYEIIQQIDAYWEKKDYASFLEKIYIEFPSISIDYALLEKVSPLYMIPATFQWDDIGNWSSLQKMLIKDDNSNVVIGKAKLFETKNCFFSGEDLNILAIGLENIIFIKHKDDLLILNKDYEDKLKSYLKKIKDKL